MKKYKVTASYVTFCEVEIEAESESEAFLIAKELDGGAFNATVDGDDWQIDKIVEIKG